MPDQVGTEGSERMAAYGVDEVGLRIAQAEEGLQGILCARSQAEATYREQDQKEVMAFETWRLGREKGLRGALEAEEGRFNAERQQVLALFQKRTDRADRASSGIETRARKDLQREINALQKQLQEAKEEIFRARPAGANSPEIQVEAEALHAGARQLEADVMQFAAGHGAIRLASGQRAEPDYAGAPADFGEALGLVADKLRDAKRALCSAQGILWLDLTKGISIVLVIILDLLAHGGALWAVEHLSLGRTYFLGTLVSVPASLAIIALAILAARRRAATLARRLHDQVKDVEGLLAHVEGHRGLEERIARIMVVDEQVFAQMEEKKKATAAILEGLRSRHERLSTKINGARDAVLGRIENRHAEAVQGLNEDHRRQMAARRAEHAVTRKRLADERESTIVVLAGRWKELLEDFTRFSREASEGCRTRHPEWSSPAWGDCRLPGGFPLEAPVGSLRLDIASLLGDCERHARFPLPAESKVTLPVALGFPASGSLLIRTSTAKRGPALEILFNAATRVLTAFPPGKAKLTIVDPVGLGQSFAALMHLSDHDESLVGGRIWTDQMHIERRLSDLTEHLEKVIQKYLRNRYATIDDYNREAGEIKEAYQFLVVADFPTAFSDLALERMASIINSGVQCGVYTLMFHDGTHPLPKNLDLGQFRRNGAVLTLDGESFVVDRKGFARGSFSPEAPPGGQMLAALLDVIGRQAQAAQRVEVPFSAVAPAPEQVWSASAENDISVPVGRAGADRLQHVVLGRGTAQHALIGGRTGSGKSNLLHVIVANASMWFSPRELEFYLIDFKHGVEFKTFATHQLPHARVIAIESDREFGLSVLGSIQRELGRRGEIFRKLGVQDLAGYRRSGAGEHLPRILLIIDEFQEFFTEDDAIARDAALLLDRFVRQGRAFGIHAILGSQTLSGVYTLAKSTLGQMGVRIALQCNEADSHLILSEDNAAARLLSRPGEAIYNDRSGLVEGNSPFQIVWLPDAVEEGFLRQVAEKAAREGWRPPQPQVVFEGNAPAELSKNSALWSLLARKFKPEDVAERIWLGDANALKGPTEVTFSAASGNHLLMIGQHREAVLAMACSAVVSLAASHPPEGLRIVILSGEGRETEAAGLLGRLAGMLPHKVELVGTREIPRVMEELAGRVATGKESSRRPEGSVYLLVLGLQRFPSLKQGDEFKFSSDREGEVSPGERFADIVRDGPAQGVHTVVWCDTLNNLNRALSRKSLREFDQRVLFQMSPADSSELVDSTAGGSLGLHNALLAIQSEGLAEKFRPYAIPDAECLERIRSCFAARFPRAENGG